jgi:hypothetical protein
MLSQIIVTIILSELLIELVGLLYFQGFFDADSAGDVEKRKEKTSGDELRDQRKRRWVG